MSKGVHKCLELLDQHRIGGDRKRSLSKGDKAANTEKKAKKEPAAASAGETRKQRSLDAFLPPPKRAPKPEPEEEDAIVISD